MSRAWRIGMACLLAAALGTPAGGDERATGDAARDPHNPVRVRWKGQRLDLWSLREPARPRPPATRGRGWARNPIDQFMLARLEGRGLAPAPEADRRTLIRRLSFGLLGLPPTAEEVAAFVADRRPDAYGRLVDRLLASPHYGERWGRHWLDVARYADSNGFERDEFRPTAWRYRDYVVRAFNGDKPYDRFLREQLAGDELAGRRAGPEPQEMRVAVGFLRLGPWDTTKEIAGLDSPERARDELLTDLTNTTAAGLLGLTFACCRCHDHKYDPFLQADYYRLRAFFAAVRFHDYPVQDFPPAASPTRHRVAQAERELAPLQPQEQSLLQVGRRRVRAGRRPWIKTLRAVRAGLGKLPGWPGRDEARALLGLAPPLLDAVPDAQGVAALTSAEKKRYEPLHNRVARWNAWKDLARAPGVREDPGRVPPTRVLRQGDFRQPGRAVRPGLPSVFDPRPAAVRPRNGSTGRRSALADWVASRHNPLTARVLVNRLWQHHFGRGLVDTPDDFGHAGARPSHPELLDWLAVEFMEAGWSVKHVQRLIVTSAAYRQASAAGGRGPDADPDNRLFGRQNVARLDAETLRDALLAVSGRLRPMAGGPPRWPAVPEEVIRGQPSVFEECDRLQGYYADPEDETDVRSLFLVRKRGIPLPLLQAFNLPDPSCTCGRRDVSTGAAQALVLLNNPFAVRTARALAARVAREAGPDPGRRVAQAFRRALGREPDAGERAWVLRQYRRLCRAHAGGPKAGSRPADRAALADVCLALLNTNEFFYID